MAIPASESCNPCENADAAGTYHAHPKGVSCDRRMYRGDFYCACRAEYVPDAVEATRPKARKPYTPPAGRY
jgi:hypothetical protein